MSGSASEAALLGVWMLTAFHLVDQESGEESDAFGPNPVGTIVFHPEGRFFALVTPGAGSPPPDGAAGQVAARIIAYSGLYRFEPPNAFVTSVDIAWLEPWIGSEQKRYWSLEGDRLLVTTAPAQMPRPDGSMGTVVARLAWQRERRAGETGN